MGYSVKWVMDNLGITRNALRYYERETEGKKQALMPKSRSYECNGVIGAYHFFVLGISFSEQEWL